MPRTLVGRALLTFAIIAAAGLVAALVARPLDPPAQVGAVLAATCLAALLAPLLLATSLRERLRAIAAWILALADGAGDPARPTATGPAEADAVARAVDTLASRRATEIRALAEARASLARVLENMGEGVIVVDEAERITLVNPAGARYFGTNVEAALGRPLEQVARHAELLRLAGATASGAGPDEAEIELEGAMTRLLHVRCSALRDGEGAVVGALLVLNDVTRLRRLEGMRRDFVANVSHEIRTPITAIKGFVETLLDGAIGDPEEAERFLRIVGRHVDRLNAIVEDLLALSRLEQDGAGARIAVEERRLDGVVRASIEACRFAADARSVAIEVSCEDGLVAPVNAPLLEQALVNLLDNAIKFSDPGRVVTVEARGTGGEAVITVTDRGPGIEAEHLPRLFERFYRVDKARSRTVGGTGLGLAIVKHVAQAHGGRASVASTPGVGSAFSLHLPLAPRAAGRALTEN